MRIFFDLDDTLIHSQRGGQNKHRIYRRFEGDGSYGSILRPTAKDLIAYAKTIDPNPAMITTAVREWAETWNEVFELGFTEIYAREDFLIDVWGNYGHKHEEVLGNLNIEDAVIIDNYPHSFEHPQQKQRFVFGHVCQERWIQINEFFGLTKDDWVNKDKKHIAEIQEKIERIYEKGIDREK